MRASIRTGAAALAVAAGLLAGAPPASADVSAQAPPSAEQVRLGMLFFDQMMSATDFNALVAKGITSNLAGPDGELMKIEPKWRDFVVEAMSEEMKADHAAIVTVMGRAFARNFTADELKVGIAVFRDPVMPKVMDAIMAGRPAPAGENLQTTTLQAMTTPAGQSFLKKFSNIGPVMDGAKSDLGRVLLPGFFQRFGDKAMAFERQRRQAEGLPAAGG
jgi:hypothetical protein